MSLKDAWFQYIIEIPKRYVNHESAYPGELKKTTRDGDEIYLTFMLAGG
jgi:hypothetical protein